MVRPPTAACARLDLVRAEDVRSYVGRDWQALAAVKDEAWIEQRRSGGVAGALRLADELRREVMALRPDWPSEDDRAEDLATHSRVAEILRGAGRASGC